MPTKTTREKSAGAAEPLSWKRPVRSTGLTGIWRHYVSRCGHYRVGRIKHDYNGELWYAERETPLGWRMIGPPHRKKGPAFAACEREARRAGK
jgi:hypothetical protein